MQKPKIRFKKEDGSAYGDWSKKKVWELTAWDKTFKDVEKNKQIHKSSFKHVSAQLLKELNCDGNVTLLSTGQFEGTTTRELAGDNLNEAEIVAIPSGGTANVKYHNGAFVDSGNILAVASDAEIIDMRFLAEYMKLHINQIDACYRGASIKHPSMKAVLDIDVSLPSSKEEQSKIADLLSEVDRLIASAEAEAEETKEFKKCMLQKMFPKDGTVVPEIRFPGFTDDWEQRKLGDMGTLKNGMNFAKEAMGKGFPFVNLQNIFGNNTVDVDNLGLAEASDKQLCEYNLEKGDVLFVRSSVKLEGVGEAALVPEKLINTTYSGFIIRFRDEYGLDNNYKRFVFSIKSIRDQIMSQATNSANKNISQPVLSNLIVPIPSYREQVQIGEFFNILDNTITLHQRKCEAYKELKKALLQQMLL